MLFRSITDKQEFNFIQEQIIPKKTWKNVLGSIVKTILLAILFGIVSSIVLCVAYPYIKNIITEDEEGRLTTLTKQIGNIRIAAIVPDCKVPEFNMKDTTTPSTSDEQQVLTLDDYKNVYITSMLRFAVEN